MATKPTHPIIDLDQVIDWLEKDSKTQMKSYSFYLSKPLFEEFKSMCYDRTPGKVISYLMQAYINAVKTRQTK